MTHQPAPLEVRVEATDPEVDIQDVSWAAEGAYVRFRGPRGRRVAFVPTEAIDATRAGRDSRTAAVSIDGGPALGEFTQVLADELAFHKPARRRSRPPVDTLEPAPPRGTPESTTRSAADWVVIPALAVLGLCSAAGVYLMMWVAAA